MLIRDRLKHDSLTTIEDLQSFVLTCLYISYSYMGNEISYPLKPFIAESAVNYLYHNKKKIFLLVIVKIK